MAATGTIESSDKSFQVFNELRKTGRLCDVILRADGKDFPANRNILVACSPFFRALFTNAISSTLGTTVEIPEVDAKIFGLLLDYAYTHSVNLTEENVLLLLPLADRFDVPGLLDMCCKFLAEHLSSENAIDVWRFARSYFCYDLEKEALRFILIFFFDIAFSKFPDNAREFVTLTIDELLEIIKDDDLNVIMEESVFRAVLKWIRYNLKERMQHMYKILLNIRFGMMNTDYFLNAVKDHAYITNNEECRSLIAQTLKYFSNLECHSGPSRVISRPRQPYEILFAVGGFSSEENVTGAIECYDTRADRWTMVDSEPFEPLAYAGIVAFGQKLYVIGGFQGQRYTSNVKCFDPLTKRWSEKAPMHTHRCFANAVVVKNFIYVMGGFNGQGRLRTVERYDPRSNQWTMMPSMSNIRSDASACNINGRIVVAGGFTGDEILNTCEMFTPETGQWSDMPRMSSRRTGLGCVSFRNAVYVVGGYDGDWRLDTVEKWSLGSSEWITCPRMYACRCNFGIAVLDDMIFAIGGYNGITTTSQVECFDLNSEIWYDAEDMHVSRSALGVVVVAGLPNVSQYTWPRERALPTPSWIKLGLSTLTIVQLLEIVSSQSEQGPLQAQLAKYGLVLVEGGIVELDRSSDEENKES